MELFLPLLFLVLNSGLIQGSEGLSISIRPAQTTQIRAEGTNAVIYCTANLPESEKEAEVIWTDPSGLTVPEGKGRRVYIEREPNLAKLYITSLMQEDSGRWTCAASSDGNIVTKHVDIKLFRDIEIEAPSPQTVILGSDGLVRCVATGEPQPTVTWRYKGRRISTGGRYKQELNGLRIRNVTSDDGGRYTCRAEVTSDGRLEEAHITVTVTSSEYLSVSIRPAQPTQVRAEGSNAVLYCTANMLDSKKEAEVLWGDPSGHAVPEGKGRRVYIEREPNLAKLYITSLMQQDAGRWMCAASSDGNVRTKSVNIEIFRDIEIEAPSPQTLMPGSNGLVRCVATGDPQPTVSWKHNGRRISTGGRYRQELTGLRIRNVTSDDRGRYTCRALVASEGRLKEAHITVTVPSIPGKPRAVKVVSLSPTTVQLGVEAPVTDGGTPISGYRVKYDDHIVRFSLGPSNATQTWFTLRIENLRPATLYRFEISAENEMGNGQSIIFQHTTESMSVPGRPQAIQVASSSPTTVGLDVEPPTNDGGRPITGYKVKYDNHTHIFPLKPDTENKKRLTLYIENLRASTQYRFEISAGNEMGYGRSIIFRHTTESIRTPYPVTIVSDPKGSDPYSYTAEWEILSNGGLPIRRIIFSFRKVSVKDGRVEQPLGGWLIERVNTNPEDSINSYSITMLQSNTSYQLKIVLLNDIGASQPNSEFVFRTADGVGIPSRPQAVRVVSSTPTTLDVAVQPPVSAGDSPIIGYRVKYEGHILTFSLGTNNATQKWLPLHIENLRPATHYRFEINAENEKGNGRSIIFLHTTESRRTTTTIATRTTTAEDSVPDFEVTLHPRGSEVVRTVGSSFVLRCKVTGLDQSMVPSFTWAVNSQEVTGQTSRIFEKKVTDFDYKLYIFDVQTEDSGTYECAVSYGEKTEYQTVNLRIYKALSIDHAPPSQLVWAGSDALIECQASGVPTPNVWWMKKGEDLLEGSKYQYEPQGLRIFNVSRCDSGLYTCIAEATKGGFFKDALISVTVR